MSDSSTHFINHLSDKYEIQLNSRKITDNSFCGVVVITFVSHTKGPQFETGQKQADFLLSFKSFVTVVITGSIFVAFPLRPIGV